ncbi:hypothetical protein [Streptosporangium minutum]|uniref:hypothetical protein n=1 Tax=Streptosporangium minutum TaxID=569862 RepID=UPI0013FD6953|nr:hypothetical protein [Streptosporangium minutum]
MVRAVTCPATSCSIGQRLEPFVKDSRAGEIETLAVRHQGEPRSIGRDSVVHVAVAVRHGSTMVCPR